MKPDALFYLGVYGGYDYEGIWEEDTYEPRRFFSFFTDEHLRRVVEEIFQVYSYRQILPDGNDAKLHFQSLILRNKGFHRAAPS